MSGEQKNRKGNDLFQVRRRKLLSGLRKQFSECPTEDAEDALQEAYYRALCRRKKDCPIIRDSDAWIYTVARNRMIDHMKNGKNEVSFSLAEETCLLSANDKTGEILLSFDIELFLKECGEKTAKILRLLCKGFTPTDIAAEVEMKTEAVYKIIQRCREPLRKWLDLPPPISVPNKTRSRWIFLVCIFAYYTRIAESFLILRFFTRGEKTFSGDVQFCYTQSFYKYRTLLSLFDALQSLIIYKIHHNNHNKQEITHENLQSNSGFGFIAFVFCSRNE